MTALDGARYVELGALPAAERLGEEARRLLRRLSVVDAFEPDGWVAAAVLATRLTAGTDALDELVDGRLLDARRDAAGLLWYRLHDLVRAFGRERPATEDRPEERDGALRRVMAASLETYPLARGATRGYGRLSR